MATTKKKATKKKTVKKSTVKKTAVKKKIATKKAAVKKKATAKKAAPKKKVVKKAAAKKAAPKKSAAKKTASKKAAPKKTTSAVKKKATVTKAKTKKAATEKQPALTHTQGGFAPYIEKKGEEYMNDNQVAHFHMILDAWKQELMEEVDRTVHHMQDEAANFPDPNDRASQESEFALELRARDRERKLIKKIEESINNLDNGDYGYCEICGIEIGIRRLEARPTATLCIDCKTLDEIREKQVRG